MRKKSFSIFIVGVFVVLNIFSSETRACTLEALDVNEQAQDLQKFMLERIDDIFIAPNIEPDTIISLNVSDASADYQSFDPAMWCPDALTAKATFSINFHTDTSTGGCFSVVTVSKTKRYYYNDAGNVETVKYEYETKLVQHPPMCYYL